MMMFRRMMAAILMLCVLLGAAAQAAGEFTFSLTGSGDGYVVTGYSGSDAAVTVPDWYRGLPVTEIGSGAFQGKTGVTAVSLPSTVVRIGRSAFKGCTGLSRITSYAAAAQPPRLPGDANGDDAVDSADALLLMQHAAGWNVSLNASNADVNADGAVTLEDAVLLFRWCAGENVTLK